MSAARKRVRAGDYLFVDVPDVGPAPMHVVQAGGGLVYAHFLPLEIGPADVESGPINYGPEDVHLYLCIWSSHLRDVEWPHVRGPKDKEALPDACRWPLPLTTHAPPLQPLPAPPPPWEDRSYSARKHDSEYEFAKTLQHRIPLEVALQMAQDSISSPGSFELRLSRAYNGLSPWTYLAHWYPERADEMHQIWAERDRALPWSVPDSIYDDPDPQASFEQRLAPWIRPYLSINAIDL